MAINTSFNVNAIIKYLRSNLQNPNINNTSDSPAYKIDGAAAMIVAEDDSRIMVDSSGKTLSSLFILWGACKATVVSRMPLDQSFDQRIIVIACLDNTQDRTGKYAQALIPIVRQDLFNYLLNKRLDMSSFPIIYVGDEMIKMDKARYWHRFEFSMTGRLQPPDGADLDLGIFNTFTADFDSTIPTANNPMAQAEVDNLYYPPDVPIPPMDNKE